MVTRQTIIKAIKEAVSKPKPEYFSEIERENIYLFLTITKYLLKIDNIEEHDDILGWYDNFKSVR